MTRNSPKDSIMFNAFTSNRTTKYDVETKAKILNESNQINKCPVEADLMYQTKKIPFKYSITTPTELENSNENEKSMQEKNPQVLERQNSFQGYDRTENNDIASEEGSKNLNNQEKACLPIYLVIHKFDTAQSSTEIIDIMVQPKKGTKLRDLLRPIFSNQSIDVEKYSLHDQSLTATTSLVDLNSLCDAYSGVKLALKYNDRGKESVNKFIDTESTEHSKLRKKSFQGLKSDSYQNSMSENLASHSFQQSTNNWQNYFNHKMSMSKDKANNKQKRNSCIAVMNDLNSQSHISISGQANANNSSLAPSPASTLNAIASSSVTSIPNNQPSMRDSVNSIQSIIPSQGSTSPADRSHRTSVKNFRKMSQLTNIFNNYGNANKNKDQLKATMDKLLESFLIELPKLPSELCANHYNPSMFEIEPDWNKFVGDSFAQSLQKNQAKQQMAIWELLSTEASHIKTTKIIIDVFLSCLVKMKCHEQTAELFKDIEINKLFSNIIEVFNCNLNFWQTYFYPIVENLQQNNSKIIDPSMLVDGFSNFKSLFAPYEEFILEKSNSLENFKKYTEENEFFSKFIMWAENNPLVGRLKIADFMMIPVQRLTKYELLLKKIHQFTEDESKREQIAYAIDCVYALPNSINTQLKYLAQFNNISESIEKYEGIVGPTDEINDILSSYKNLDIKSPLPGCLSTSNRELIHQGPLKLKDTPKSFDVHCFLFTDILLITQLKKTKKYKIIRPPVLTNRIIVRELSQTDKAFVVISLNDYKVPESVCMFISNQSKKWIEFLEIAQLKYLDEIQKAKNFNNDTSLTMFGHKNPVRRDTSLKTPSLEITSDNVESSTDENNNSSIDSSGKPLDTNNSNERRDSSATITLSENDNKDVNVYVNYNEGQTNISENGNKETSIDERKIEANNLKTNSENSINSSNSFKSLKSGQCRQYQQQHNVRFNSRILDRRIQRRNMTDPLSTASQINSIIDEKHSVIMNSIIKRNSLNEKPKISPNKSHHLTTNLCGDSTSTILSTDSGVSSTSCENNHISYSDESISKSPSNAITFEANRENNAQQDKSIEEQNEESLKRSSLKPTNSVLSTTSSTFSSSSSSHEPNMSYSSSFNSTLSSSRFASKTNSLSKKNANKNALNEMENENRVSVEDYVNSNDTNILSGDEDYNGYYDIDETNLSNILNDPDSNVMKDLDDQNSCFTAAYNEVYPSRRLFSTVKIKNKSLSDMSNRQNQRQNRTNTIGEYINHNSNNQKYLNSPSANYDLNNNDTINNNNIKNEPIMGELGNQYFELINKSLSNQQDNQTRFNNSQLKFQQPNFSLNSNFGQNVKKKPLVKINSTTMTNDLIRVNPNDILLKNPQSNEHYHDPMSAQHCLDSNQRMTLVKLLHTTMDATEV